MTPFRIASQQVNDAPYTTPAKRGPEIWARVYSGNVISSRGLFRIILNDSIQVSESSIYTEARHSNLLVKHIVFYDCFYTYLCHHRCRFKFLSYSFERRCCRVLHSYLSLNLLILQVSQSVISVFVNRLRAEYPQHTDTQPEIHKDENKFS
jgi:hypothetical protein